MTDDPTIPSVHHYNVYRAKVASYNKPTVVCPSSGYFRLGTWTLGVYAIGQANYTLHIDALDLKELTNPPRQSGKCINETGFICLNPDVPTSVNFVAPAFRNINLKYTFSGEGCQEVHFWSELETITNSSNSVQAKIINGLPLWLLSYSTTPNTNPSPLKIFAQPSAYLLQGADMFVELCRENSTVPATLYLSLWSSFSGTFSVIVETDQKSWKRRKLSTIFENPYNDMPFLNGGVTLNCANSNYFGGNFRCDPSSYFFNGITGCHVFSSFLDNPYFQPPPLLKSLGSSTPVSVYQTVENSLITNASYLNDDRTISFVLYKLFDKYPIVNPKIAQNLDSCSFIFDTLSPISNKDGKRIQGTIHPKKTEPKCTREVKQISEKVDSILGQLLRADSYQEALTHRYEVDKLELRNSWLGCEAYLSDYLNVTESTTIAFPSSECRQEYGSKEYEEDPCCSLELGWESCCPPDRIVEEDTNRYEVGMYPNNCYSPSCVSDLLDRYSFYVSVSENPSICVSKFNEYLTAVETYLIALKRCESDIYGTKLTPPSCISDEDCESNSCDLVSKKCYHNKDSTERFWECVETTVMTKELATNLYGIGVSISSAVKKLRREVTTSDQCYNAYGPDLRHGIFERASAWPMCEVKQDFYCLDTFCQYPLSLGSQELFGRIYSNCDYQWFYSEQNTVDCQKSATCLWNNTLITKEDCESGDQMFCGVCGGDKCIVNGELLNESSCENTFACMHANGSVTYTNSEEECSKMSTCTKSCGGGECKTEEECETSGGYCSGLELFTFIQNTYGLPQPPETVCLFETRPFNIPDCYLVSASQKIPYLSTPYSIGCVAIYNEKICSQNNGTALYLPSTREKCSSIGEGCLENSFTEVFSPKSSQDCARCHQEMSPKFSWIPGSWRRSVPKRLEWQQKRFTRNTTLIKGPNFVELSSRILNGAVLGFVTDLQTQSYCKLAAKKSFIEAVSCACLDFEEDSDTCFDIPSPTLGAARICPDSNATILAVPAILEFKNADVVGTECVTISAFDVIPSTFLNVPIPGVSPTYAHARYDGSTKESVKNKQDTIVGEVLSDGIKLEVLSGSFDIVQSFTLCFYMDEEVTDEKTKYKTYDFATKLDNDSLIPLNVDAVLSKVDNNGNLLCGIIFKEIVEKVREGYYVPIAREKHWEEADYRNLSPGEQATLLIVACLYFFAVLLGLYTLYCAIDSSGHIFRNDPAMIIKICTSILIVTCFIRFIYFILSGSKAVYFVDYHTAEEILVELPAFMYVTAFTLVAVAFFYTALGIKRKRSLSLNRYVWLPFGLATFCLMSFFGIAIGLLEYFYKHSLSYEYCGSTIVSASRNDSINQFRVAYRAVLAAYIALVSLFLFANGYYLAKTADSKKLKQPLRMLFLVGVVGCCSLLSGIIFIIYYLVFDPSPYFTWVLLVVEILPCVVIFLHMIGPKRFNLRRPSHTSSHKKSRARSTSTSRSISSSVSAPTGSFST
eukprot:TRINITY_DN464_c0_g1_i8.p1 TRINITY_DN464_c0_g1~~TRINITY_DN464_c0_g1_i8.p1  ORF type:complete len:1482 (+),score=141.67 TRINITY_DN464_c0_g1_i8:791-5236(+)